MGITRRKRKDENKKKEKARTNEIKKKISVVNKVSRKQRNKSVGRS